MKNQALYQQYAILGWPCPFLTIGATDKYNAVIAKYCNQLPNNAISLSRSQRVRLRIYIRFLHIYDVVMSIIHRT